MNPNRLFTLVCLLFSSLFSVGQGTTSYRVALNGAFALPSNQSARTASGTFAVDADLLFRGFVGLENYAGVTAVTLFRSTSAFELGTAVFDFTPGTIFQPGITSPGGRRYDITQTITATQAADLQSGYWWVNLSTTGFPNGEIRGQITSVPEPSGVALLAMGISALGLRVLRRSAARRHCS